MSNSAEEGCPRVPRSNGRCNINAEANLRRSGRMTYRVCVHDLSPLGCKLEYVDRPELNETVWLKFDAIDAFEARVCWVEGRLAGVEFHREIYQPIYEHLLTKLGGSSDGL